MFKIKEILFAIYLLISASPSFAGIYCVDNNGEISWAECEHNAICSITENYTVFNRNACLSQIVDRQWQFDWQSNSTYNATSPYTVYLQLMMGQSIQSLGV